MGKTISRWIATSEKACPRVSIIILNYNGHKYLKKCLQSVLDANYANLEIIIVDNGSTDGSLEEMKSHNDNSKFKAVFLTENIGFSKGNNMGASLASGKYLAFLNNDTIVDRNWLAELVTVMEQNQNIGAAQPKLFFLDKPNEIQSAGNYIDTMGFTIPRIRIREAAENFDQYAEISATGAAVIVRRDLFFQIHGFEPNFFAYYEDTDLSWRIRLSGKSVIFVPSSIVYHAEGAGLSRIDIGWRIKHYVKNQLYTVFKNYSLKNAFQHLLLLFFIYSAGATWLALKRTCYLPTTVLRAFLGFLKMFRLCWKSRLNVQMDRKVDDKELLGSFLKPFAPYHLFHFYSRRMGYASDNLEGKPNTC